MQNTRFIKKFANPEQQWLVERGAAPTLLAGGINSGKTAGCVMKSLGILTKYKGSRMGVIRRSKTQLMKTTVESWYQWCLPQMYNKGKRNEDTLDLNNGSRVYFIHLDQPNSLDLLAGLELNFAYVSQAEEITEKAWDLLDVRVGRWTSAEIPQEDFDQFGGRERWPWRSQEGTCVPPRYIFAESYVTDEAHWLYTRFAPDSPEREKWDRLGYASKTVFTESNIYAIQANVEAALAKDDDYVRRYVRPVWGNPEGKIFTINPMSMLEPTPALVERILRTMKLHRTLDHGETAATCVLWCATDYDGNIFVYREYYQPDALISFHRQMIYEFSKDDGGRYHSNVADPTIFNKDRGKTANTKPKWSVADDYKDTRIIKEKHTVINWVASQNDEEATRSRMKEYLRVDPTHKHPLTGKYGAPRLYFLKRTPEYPRGCKEVHKQIGAQMRLKSKVGDREVWLDDRDESIVDHAYDSCKYFVVGRPSLGPMIMQQELGPGEIPVAAFEAAQEAGRRRRRLEERQQASSDTSNIGYGE